jgi:hypothetical protein
MARTCEIHERTLFPGSSVDASEGSARGAEIRVVMSGCGQPQQRHGLRVSRRALLSLAGHKNDVLTVVRKTENSAQTHSVYINE